MISVKKCMVGAWGAMRKFSWGSTLTVRVTIICLKCKIWVRQSNETCRMAAFLVILFELEIINALRLMLTGLWSEMEDIKTDGGIEACLIFDTRNRYRVTVLWPRSPRW